MAPINGRAALTRQPVGEDDRRGPESSLLVTDDLFAETIEQLSCFYIITCEEDDALVEAAEVLLRAHAVVEIRPVEEL